MSYAGYSASVVGESPFKLLSQISFGADGKVGGCAQLLLQQQQQQMQQKQHLLCHHTSQLSQQQSHSSHSHSQRWSRWSVVLVVAALLAAVATFAPLSSPLNTSSLQQQEQQHPSFLMQQAPATARLIQCQVLKGGSLVSSLCDVGIGVGVSYDGSAQQQHTTVWQQGFVAAGLVQPGAVDVNAAAGLDDGSSDTLAEQQEMRASGGTSAAFNGRHHLLRLQRLRRQQHRKFLRLV